MSEPSPTLAIPPAPGRLDRVLLAIYCFGFGFGTLAHLVFLISKTELLLPVEMPQVWNVVMKALLVLNPLAVVLLLVRRRAGLLLAVGILALVLVMNVGTNVLEVIHDRRVTHEWLYLNGTFCVFGFLAFRRLWRASPRVRAGPAAVASG